MTAVEILDELRQRGVTLRVQDGQIVARPLSVVDDDLRQAVKANKQEVLALLSTEKGTKPEGPNRETSERALQLVRSVAAWLGSLEPYVKGIRGHLSMPHADGFGQVEYKRLVELENQLDRFSLAVARGEATKQDFERAFKEYQRHWGKIRRLFVKTFKLDPGCPNCGFPHAADTDCLVM
jgi:hypothetical protein